MTDINSDIIFCPYCKTSITVDELGEHVNANPETKKQAIEQEIELWGEDAYDRNYLIQNVVFCPSCNKSSHFNDWDRR
jgi:uncharacterized protein YbaR (Trm112 family)